MNITELDSYNLADAVKFHNRLNPKIWGKDEQLLPEVRQKLLEIAADFQEFLGIDDLAVEDITVSGSNAAYSYTPHSDIDLHLVVRMPEDADEVYQELFNAKKYQYNDLMDIKIHGADVELYVQPADEAPVSLGEYSIKNDQWIQVPRRKRAKIDHSVVKHKYEDLKARIETALKENDSDRIQALIDKIKAMRQSGLDAHGEFGAENLAFKMLRSQGYIKKLYDHRAATRARELSLKEQNKPKQRFRYGFSEGHQGQPYSSEDGVAPTTAMFVTEDDSTESVVRDFIDVTAKRLGIETMPTIELHSDDNWSIEHHSFGMYEPETHTLHVNLNDRHVLDILRTTAHELVHCRQNELSKLPDDAGKTGSPWENEAHAVAGEIMRDYADANPDKFKDEPVNENASGYIPKNKKEARDPRYKMAVTVDVGPGQVGKEANKLALQTGKNGEPGLLMKSANLLREFEEFKNQDLFEIKMSPSNLRQEAAKTGAMAGMEFEMIVPNVGDVDNDPEYERDEDMDRRARSFDDIEEFFYDGDYNGRGDIRRLMDSLREDFENWKMERLGDDWQDEGIDYLRDYIANNDEFDRDDALDTVRDEIIDANPDLPQESEDFQQLLNARLNEMEEQFVLDVWEQGIQGNSRIYDNAFEEFVQEKAGDMDESDWLHENTPYMSDVEYNYDIQWPYYYDVNQYSGESNVDEVADEFSQAIGRPVNASSNYHGARREPGKYVVEPDGSLDPDDGNDTGLEFVSPPLPIDELLSDLNKVKEWAGDRGCYTNSSTGLHINISVPNFSLEKLDYVKLALLLGDKYVLDQFGRSSNTYTKSALGKVESLVKQKPEVAKALLDKMRGHMEDLATKAIHSGTTDKYTSINTKTGYIEFRSPGGDWLDANFSKIENTLLRFTVALSAAINPEAYREEYLKKLYKLLEPVGQEAGQDTIKYFSDYVAGKMPKAALRSFIKQAQLERKIKRGDVGGEEFKWEVGRPGYGATIIVRAKTKEEAINRALEPDGYPDWASARNQLTAKPIGPADTAPVRATAGAAQPVGQRATAGDFSRGNWGIWIDANNRFANQPGEYARGAEVPLYRFPSREAAESWIEQQRAERPWMRRDIEVREIPPRLLPGSTLDLQRQRAARADAERELNQPSWFVRPVGQPGREIQLRAADPLGALARAREMRNDIFGDLRNHQIEVRSGEGGSNSSPVHVPAEPQAQQSEYELYRISDGRAVTAPAGNPIVFRADSPEDAESKIARYAADFNLGAPELFAVRSVLNVPQTQQSAVNTPPQNGGTTGNWGLWITTGERFARWPGEYGRSETQPLRRFETREAAEAYLENLRQTNPRVRTDVEVREIEPTQDPSQFQEPSDSRGTLTPRGPGPWEIYRISDGSSVRELAHTNRNAAETEARSALGLRGEAPELYGVRTRQQSDAAQGGIVDVASNQVGQTYTPSGSGSFTGQWMILDPNNTIIYKFGGIGNNQSDANRLAMDWLTRNPRQMVDGVTVVPEMG